ncbi:peptidase inhibitor family I36 protein [Streptomyces rubiginosohelvolus]|uniref:peptidase inhibitor family I36 protein n=1 Tax=Streptomyces TaxID=1883 RepID=UPI001CD7A850|nr:peptidase inhibitor family I36 protein [Streptomyces sp. 7G]
MVAGSAIVAAPPAQAAPFCPSGHVCLWRYANYSGERVVSASTNACIRIPGSAIQRSYINNLPVTAVLWQQLDSAPWTHFPVRTLPVGGFSSDFGTWYGATFVCTNGKTPA